jgi:hypothetical protein
MVDPSRVSSASGDHCLISGITVVHGFTMAAHELHGDRGGDHYDTRLNRRKIAGQGNRRRLLLPIEPKSNSDGVRKNIDRGAGVE